MTKIIVIEDAADLRELVIEMLTLEGFEVLGAENGRLGIELIRTEQPDLVICDIMMAEIDGYGVLEAIRHDPQTVHTPFIFLTAQSDRSYIRRGMRLGADDFVVKPFLPLDLLESIRQRLARSEEERALRNHHIEDLRHSITASLPHELHTPLNIILGYAQLLISEADTVTPPQILDWAGNIQRSAKRLLHLTENYLCYTRLRLLKTSAEELRAYRAQTTSDLHVLINDQALRIAARCDRPDDLLLHLEEAAEVRCAAHDALKVVDELLDNAFKFSEAGTRVEVRGQQQVSRYLLTIRDYGRGFKPEQVARVAPYIQFERQFFEQQGVGLGLSLARQLMELFGGRVTIEGIDQTQGGGTLVRVEWLLA
ncbi:MAG: response regulator [Anaerolineae bacterium]|nr:response regulator [Anaerolineae bacterium]MDW8172832.1 response regulator [Anaerolineae bacterium]